MVKEPDRDMIDYLSGEMTPERRAAFEARLAEDAELRREVEAAGETLADLRALPDLGPGELTRAKILGEARRKAENPERRRFRDVFESPLLQTVALASLVLGIAFLYEDYLPHAGLPSFKDALRAKAREQARNEADEAVYPETAAAGREDAETGGSRILGIEAPAEEARRQAKTEAAPPAAAPAPTALADAPGLKEKKQGEEPFASASGEALSEDLAKGPAPMAGVLERPAPTIDVSLVQDLIKQGRYGEALEKVEALLAKHPDAPERTLLLELGADAADKADDDFRRVYFRAQLLQAKQEAAAGAPPPARAGEAVSE